MNGIVSRSNQNGRKMVVVFTGWGLSVDEWEFFYKDVADIATLVSYNRNGYGSIPEGIYPRTGMQIAYDFAEFLKDADIKEKVIIIAHDAGGIYARIFADKFPEKVEGIIFVDSLTEFENEFYLLNTPKYFDSASNHARMSMMRQLLLTDVVMHRKMLEPMMEIFYGKFSESARNAILSHAISKSMIRTLLSEYDTRDESFELLAAVGKSDIPARIIHRDPQIMTLVSEQFGVPRNESTTIEEMWYAHTTRLADNFPNSKMIEAKGSDHSIHISDPELIINTLKDLINDLHHS